MARRVRQRVSSAAEMQTAAMRRMWLAFARFVVTTIAEIENRHARNNKRSHTSTTWQQFCANYINQEAVVLAHARQDQASLAKSRTEHSARPVEAEARRTKADDGLLRKQTAVEIYSREFFQLEKQYGRNHKVCSEEYKALVRRKFNSLSDAQARYEMLSLSSARDARLNRARVKQRMMHMLHGTVDGGRAC